MRLFYTTLLCLFMGAALSAQCYNPATLDARMGEADVAAFGTVINSESFYNAYGEIYTRHTLQVDRYVGRAGNLGLNTTLNFFTMGGTINEERLVVYPSLRGIEGATGMFLLTESKGDRVVEPGIYRPVAMHESYLSFDQMNGTFMDADSLVGTAGDLATRASNVMGSPVVKVTRKDYQPLDPDRKMMQPTISSISPRNVNAGIGDEITITGSNFGSTPGDIFFDSPDDGPGGSFAPVPPAAIVAWSNTSITVRVISEAGSGPVVVRTANGGQRTSTQRINVDYAVTNLTLNTGDVVTPLLVDDAANGDGGYTFRVSNSTANGGTSLAGNPAALAAVNRAVTNWQQNDFNISVNGQTSIQTPARDDVNIMAFGSNAYDFNVELGTGTVGIAFSYYNSCGRSEFEVTGLDVLFRRPSRTNYNFGPAVGGGTDFESVVLHELGHTHQLKHVADANEVMSFRITNGASQRIITADTRAGADFVTNQSLAYDPPIVNCSTGDFRFSRDYLTFTQVNGSSLPVTWVSFTATPEGKRVRLDWETANEVDNREFILERSTDGANFAALGRQLPRAAAGSGAVYRGYDDGPAPGTNYYRLAQVDFDGTVNLSEVRLVRFTDTDELSVFPNPAVRTLSVRGAGLDPTRVIVYNAAGARINLAATPGEAAVDLDVSALPAGQYFVRDGRGNVRTFVR